ncbi:insect-derived growth factor-B-like protein, variant [Capsaspora owczarzaki ATCC 30864]|nr:insect-derived growth factor-B-like protein, variant [Capsaspora owczarzaki ATCC 30864]
MAQRGNLLQFEAEMRTAADLPLTSLEQSANQILMQLKDAELAKYRHADFPPSLHFFSGKHLISDSPVMNFLQALPKGGALHLHSVSMVRIDWIIETATYDPTLYSCFNTTSGAQSFRFSAATKLPSTCNWVNVVAWRQASGNATAFDAQLFQNMTVLVDDPVQAYPTQDIVWQKFQSALSLVDGMVAYIPYFIAYTTRAMQELVDDNVQYAEFRTTLTPLYDINGNVYSSAYQMELLQQIIANFTAAHPTTFFGGKAIICGIRSFEPPVIGELLNETLVLRQQFPDLVAGFDLVSQEDPGYPLIEFLDQFLTSQQSQQAAGVTIPYFFHAGETNWIDQDVDDNLFDAVLLNTTRIGHGFAVAKHPIVSSLVTSRQIAIEVCPISNQVLKLVDDLRNHPGALYLEQNIPIVISSDDPSVWDISGLSYDFYEAFMGWGGDVLDIKTIKQLIINSIQFSAMSDAEKQAAFDLWNPLWVSALQQLVAAANKEL